MRPLCAMALACLAALAAAAGCSPLVDPGPEPAYLVVEVDAGVRPGPGPETASHLTPVRWDWGAYLVGREGRLLRLSPRGGQRLTVLETNPLKDRAVFPVPPGRNTYRVLVDAYRYYYQDRGPALENLRSFHQSYTLELSPGERRTVRFAPAAP